MIERFKAAVRRRWPRLRLRTILLLTFLFVAALPGFGALFLRVYENGLVRQTEAELIAQGAALAAVGAVDWPGVRQPVPATGLTPEPPAIDLRIGSILPERPPPRATGDRSDPLARAWADKLIPVLRLTTHTTLASILLLDARGQVLDGPLAGRSYADLPEVRASLVGLPATVLRRNDAYRPDYPLEWLSRASDLRIHYSRPIIADGRVVGVLLLARSPRALFVGLYDDRGKILLGILLIFSALVVLSGLLSRGIVRPVEALGEATRAVAAGRGSVPEPPTTAAVEIQALYRDFGVMADAIDRRSRYLRDFAHAVSHEFKTPLAGIAGAVELLQDHPDMAAADRERFLANLGSDAERLSRLVGRLLDLARADMAEASDARADVGSVLARIADAFDGADLRVTRNSEPGLPAIGLPPAAIEAVVTALVENSRQAGASHVILATKQVGAAVAITVADDGPGIPPADRERVFEPFFTGRRASGGTGLGLPIARSLLHANGGSLVLDTGEDRGASFRVVVPARDG